MIGVGRLIKIREVNHFVPKGYDMGGCFPYVYNISCYAMITSFLFAIIILFSSQILQRPKRIPHILPFGQHLIQNLPVGLGDGVEEDDGAGVGPLGNDLKGFLMTGLILLIPVHMGQAPEYGGVAQLLCHL